MTKSIYDFSVKDIQGETVSLAKYKGKSLLIVNTASKCGFTPQYSGLQKIYEQYQEKDLEILAFPCNQFGKQEPGDSAEILDFCITNYHVTFPLFEKIDVKGENKEPLFDYLSKNLPGLLNTSVIKWNFTKFFISKDGRPLKRFSPKDSPEKIIAEIKSHL